jgi:hypothetical protein
MLEKVNERSEVDGLIGRSIERTGGSATKVRKFF